MIKWREDSLMQDIHRMTNALERIASAVDKPDDRKVEEIVRCKDCKYMTEHYDADGNVPYWTCSEWDSGTDYDGFCHYAERRTNVKANKGSSR